MKLRRFLSGICTVSAGAFVVAGTVGVTVGVLVAVQKLMAGSPAPNGPAPEPVRGVPVMREHYFKIRRTRSELGYVYWVLQGYGRFHCYELYDTWQEACDEATRRSELFLAVEQDDLVTAG